MYKIGLLLLTGPFRIVVESISQYLKCANKNVLERLYVKLEPEFSKPFTKTEPVHLKHLSDFVPLIYNKASSLCQNLDIRVILSDTKKRKADANKYSKFDVILTNCKEENQNVVNYVDCHFNGNCDTVIKLLDNGSVQYDESSGNAATPEFCTFKTVCLGGTFDSLHNGHKVLLSEAALRATEKLIVGVTDGPMLNRKVLWELIEPVQKRIADMTSFLLDVDPSLHYEVVPITDPYGPTIRDPDINCIVVSSETKIGGDKVNSERKKRGMHELTMCIVDLVENAERNPGEEEKLSSSTRRMRLLGTCLKAPKVTANEFYTVLLQGPPLTGKSCLSASFKKLGMAVVCCNEIIQSLLNRNIGFMGTFCKEFNIDTLCATENLECNYGKLLSLCLKDKEKRTFVATNLSKNVNEEIQQKLQFHHKQGVKLVLIQDSLLMDGNLKLGNINELWFSLLPVSEVTKRLITRYQLTEEEALSAVMSMPSNEQNLDRCHRVFCTLWPANIIEQQVSRAWSQLKLKSSL